MEIDRDLSVTACDMRNIDHNCDVHFLYQRIKILQPILDSDSFRENRYRITHKNIIQSNIVPIANLSKHMEHHNYTGKLLI